MYSLALIIFVVSEKKAFEHFPIGSNVNLCSAVVAILVSEKKIFEISVNQSILLALAAMLNIRLERKTVTL
jgi:hypothetical protein